MSIQLSFLVAPVAADVNVLQRRIVGQGVERKVALEKAPVRLGFGVKGKVLEALGPDSEITEIRVGWFERGSGGAANQGAEGMAGGR